MPPPELIDPVNASLLATTAAQATNRQRDGADFVAEQARLQHLSGLEKIGVREAQALQETRTSPQAREILQARAATSQPQA